MKKVGDLKLSACVFRLSMILAMLGGLAACQSTPSTPEGEAAQGSASVGGKQNTPAAVTVAPARVEKSHAEQALDKGIALFDEGKYAAAIKKIKGSPEIWNDSDELKVRAHKYLAFSYCVSEQRALCRKQFEKLLVLSPGFELDAAEANHPIWGAEFKRAKNHKEKASSHKGHKKAK